jgi:hypothetical protein
MIMVLRRATIRMMPVFTGNTGGTPKSGYFHIGHNTTTMMVLGPCESANMNLGSLFEARLERTWGNPSWWNLLVVLPWVVLIIFDLMDSEQIKSRLPESEPHVG